MEKVKDKANKKMTLNLGPQHPSTHGVLRLLLEVDGEEVLDCKPIIGYLHRGMEKMAESRYYAQYLSIVERIEYLSGFFYSQAFCAAVEELMGFELPIRAEYIRVLTMEINRIASHLLWLGTFMMDLGASSPIFYTFRERDKILSILEKLTGSRMMYNYYTFGGVRHDVPAEILDEMRAFLEYFPKMVDEYEKIITNNPIFRSRTKNIGVLKSQIGLEYAITGVNLRASGVELDFRKETPYLCYDKLDFEVPTLEAGDSYDRYLLRIKEMRISTKLCLDVIDWLKTNKDEKINLGNKLIIRPKEGEAYSYVESPRGLVVCYVKSTGGDKPNRVKWRTPSFFSVGLLSALLKNCLVADIMSIFGSLDVVLPEVDR